MKITIEQVEKLQARANVSYEEAKEALEKCDGDILEALIMLEKDGKTAKPSGGTYSTNGQNQNHYSEQQGPSENMNGEQNQNNGQQGPHVNYNNQNNQQGSDFGKQMGSLWRSFCNLIHRGNINHFVMTKNYEEVMRMPVTVLVILLLIFNIPALVILIILLFFGFKYSFKGPDLGKESINNVMDSASKTAEDLKESAVNNNSNDENDGNNTNQ